MPEQDQQTNVGGDDADAVGLVRQGLDGRRPAARQADANGKPKPAGDATPATDKPAPASMATPEQVRDGAAALKPSEKPPADDELSKLRQQVADLESREKERALHLDAEYAKARFLAKESPDGVPVALLEKFIPATTDAATLTKSREELVNMLNQYVENRERARKAHPSFGGGNDGGMNLIDFANEQARLARLNGSAGSLVASALSSRRR